MKIHENISRTAVKIEQLNASAYKIPTDAPEADGTFEWNSTTIVLVEITAAGKKGIGYTYADAAAAFFIQKTLRHLIVDANVMDNTAITNNLIQNIRNNGITGIAMMAVSAVDVALWDLKSKILELPLCKLLGQIKDEMPVYGSGGFTCYSKQQLQQQLQRWQLMGIQFMKMKVGSEPARDIDRMKDACEILENNVQLMIDANGAYTVKQALAIAEQAAALNTIWFEEPVASDNLSGLRFIKDHAPAKIKIAAGEYGYNLPYFLSMLNASAVDIIQADATRCGGITGFIKTAMLAEAFQIPLSSHCAPSLHLHVAVAIPNFFLAEFFHDHERIESMLFDGFRKVKNGSCKPDLSCPGLGLQWKQKDAEKFKI